MSAPVSSFRKLSISAPMEGHEGRLFDPFVDKGKARARPQDDDSSTTETSSSEEESEDDGEEENGAHYLALDHCRQIGSRYAFQMVDAKIRKCGIRLEENMKTPNCSCPLGGGDCRHTQWLMAQLLKVRNNSPTKRPVSPYEYITSKGLGSICKTLKWEFREESEEDVREYPWALKKDYAVQIPEARDLRSRMANVRDIMASFSKIVTDDFRNDIFKNTQEVEKSALYVSHDLEGTLIHTLLRDDYVFSHFDNLVTSEVRATRYFENTAIKAQNAIVSLDDYCDDGPSHAGGTYDVIWCAQTLTDIVQAIRSNLTSRQPLTPASRISASKALVTILVTIVKYRNHDAYQNLSWKRPRKHGEPQIDRNLYQRLIGSNPAGEMFVLHVLQDLPEANVFMPDLEECLGLLETVGWSAPRGYVHKLREIVTRCKNSMSPPGNLGSKRAGAGGMEGKVKRMK